MLAAACVAVSEMHAPTELSFALVLYLRVLWRQRTTMELQEGKCGACNIPRLSYHPELGPSYRVGRWPLSIYSYSFFLIFFSFFLGHV